MKDLSKITNVLLFKNGFYWLTIKDERQYNLVTGKLTTDTVYRVVPETWELKNGFEFASDAYSYIAHLQEKEEV